MASPANPDTAHTASQLRPTLRLILLSVALWAVWAAATLWLLSPETLDKEIGDAAPFDVQSPRELAYESALETETARKAAAAAVSDIYTAPDPEVHRAQERTLQQLARYITMLRGDVMRPERRVRLLLSSQLARTASRPTCWEASAFTAAEWSAVQQEGQRLLEIGLRQQVREQPGRCAPFTRDCWPRRAAAEHSALAVHMAGRLLTPNSHLDQQAIESARQAARDAVASVMVRIRQGETIVRQGAVMPPLAYEARRTGLS